MNELYAMRRANGDWFALDDAGRFRVPLFRSVKEAKFAQLNSTGMQLFRPVVLDAASMTNLKPAKGDTESHFWLVDSPASNLKRGQILDHSQLTLLITDRQKVK